MKLFVSAGEASGDQALAAVLALLRARLPDLRLAGLGGEASEAQGLKPLVPLVETAVSGVGDVAARLFSLARARRAALRALLVEGAGRPDLVLLVDYPGLNLELARRALGRGIPVYYIAPPQTWIYKNPVRKAAKASASLRGAVVHVLFPFERETFAPVATQVVFGHFLGEAMAIGEARSATESGVPRAGSPGAVAGVDTVGILGLCPGSRRPALRRNLPAWLRALRAGGVFDSAGGPRGLLILAPSWLAEEARALAEAVLGPSSAAIVVRTAPLGPSSAASAPGTAPRGSAPSASIPAPSPSGIPWEIVTDKGRLLRETSRAFAFPGTITLELGLAGVPAAVVAALDPLTLAVGRRMVKGPWLGLPNLLLGREIYPEWAGRASAFRGEVAAGLWKLLRDGGPEGALDGDREPAAGLRALMGPANGASLAVEQCLKILGKSLQGSKIAPDSGRIL